MTTRIFAGRYGSLAEIAEFVRMEAEEAGLSYQEVFEVETAVDEAVSNVIEHAYGGEGKGDITIYCSALADGIKIIVEDKGEPFDPTCIPIPDLKAQLKDRKNHGLGYFLMCKLMDEIYFNFDSTHNVLTMVKRKKEI